MVMMVVMVMMTNASVLLQRPAAVGSTPAAAARPLEAVLQRRRAGGRTRLGRSGAGLAVAAECGLVVRAVLAVMLRRHAALGRVRRPSRARPRAP